MKNARLPFALLLLVAAACGYPRPADVGGDGGPGDAPDPGVTIHVSPSGDDANDGLASPVKTLRHAIGLAVADSRVTRIALASGAYSMSSGETFPYTVPPNVVIAGPAGGGAILTGNQMGPGVTVDTGGLQDLDLQGFTTALTVTGTATFKNLHVLTSTLAVQAETRARLTVDNLDIAGLAGACATGVVAIGVAEFTATALTTKNLGISVYAMDQSVVNLVQANIFGTPQCSQSPILIIVSSSGSFGLEDSRLEGGNNGLSIEAKSPSFKATISNTIIRNLKLDALGGRAPSASVAPFQMTGGELSNNGNAGAEFSTGTWAFTNVTFQRNGLGIYVQDGRLITRGCTISRNAVGIDVFDNATADLGTLASPGNNIFRDNSGVGLVIDGNFGGTRVDAVGNTWNPTVQGADVTGRYPTLATISGPVASVNGDNFSIASGWSLLR